MALFPATPNVTQQRISHALVTGLWLAVSGLSATGTAEAETPRQRSSEQLLIAFSSLRDRPAFAGLYLYEHDGVSSGRIVFKAPTAGDRSYTSSSLSSDGTRCLYTIKQTGGFVPSLHLFEARKLEPAEALGLGREVPSLTHARLSGNGEFLVFCGWNQPGLPGGWDVCLFSTRTRTFLDLPGLNTDQDERDVTISGDGSRIAFVANRQAGQGLSDILLFDRVSGRIDPLPELNSPQRDLNPALSADGKCLAFVSDRPGGAGGKDLYLFHVDTRRLESLPSANSVAHEQSPALSNDGRFLIFVSERTEGEGDRDLFLYDRTEQRLLATPGLNSPTEDFDPAIAGP